MSYLYIEHHYGNTELVNTLFNCENITHLEHYKNSLFIHTNGDAWEVRSIVLVRTNNKEYAHFFKDNGVKVIYFIDDKGMERF